MTTRDSTEGKPKLPDEPASDGKNRIREICAHVFHGRRRDFFVALALILFVCVLFGKTTFAGAAISKIHVIAEWDSAFNKFRTGQSQLMDPSQILLMVPYYLRIGNLWNHGQLPLWNSLSGFGGPLLADPQALAFSFLHVPLAFSPTVSIYNMVLVFELGILAVGGYLMGKAIGLSRIPSVFLGLTLLLCPYEQWYLELLGNGYCLIPLLLAAFLNAARLQTVISAVGAGVAAAVFVLSAHPELSFCSILPASILMLMMFPRSSWSRALLLLTIAGAVAFCLSAPMLLPFVEFVVNSDSYKFGNRAPAYYPWQTLAFNLIQPGYGAASPFLGVLALLALPFGIATIFDGIKTRVVTNENAWMARGAVVVGALSIFSWAVSAKVFPLGILLARKPFSYVVVTYLFPVLIVLVATLAAIGFERLLQANRGLVNDDVSSDGASPSPTKRILKDLKLLGVGLAAIVLFPLLMQVCNVNLSVANFDMTLASMTLNKRDWIRDIILSIAIIVALVAPILFKKPAFRSSGRTALVCVCVALGAVSQLAISSRSLPVRPEFSYPETDTMAYLKILGDRRAIATGVHTMRPNTNLAYGFKDARFHNPIFPARYLAFLERSGAKLDEFNQVFSDEPSSMIDLASIRLIVTPNALIERKFFDGAAVTVTEPAQWTATLALTTLRYAVDPESHAVYVEPTWMYTGKSLGKFTFNVSLVNADCSEIWISDRQPIVASEKGSTHVIGVPIGKSIKGGDELGIKLSVFESASGAVVPPTALSSKDKDGRVIVNFKAPMQSKGKTKPDRRFKLVFEGSEGIRVYENQGALEEAFVATNAVHANSAESALAIISGSDFDGRKTVVLEGTGKEIIVSTRPVPSSPSAPSSPYAQAPTPGSHPTADARILRRDDTDISIQTSADTPGFLVLTDIWYPGWSATVDGVASEVLRANYAFRAVAIPAGQHRIEFHYRPVSFYLGLALAAFATLVVLVVLILGWKKSDSTN